ncbi:MAG: T9SS type A sorting domain-containing protein, partial [Actinomycetota bacterium]
LDMRVMTTLTTQFEFDDWLYACESAMILEIREGKWRFAHDKLREGILGTLSDTEKPALYQEMAETYERIYGSDPQHALTLSHLWREANQIEKEYYYAIEAGKLAISVNVYPLARDMFRRAQHLAEQFDTTQRQTRQHTELLRGLGDSLLRTGALQRAFVEYEASVELARAIGSELDVGKGLEGLGYTAYRSGNYDIYAQRISDSGAVQWTADGVALSTAPEEQAYPTIVSDDAGGAIVTWRDHGSTIDYDIYTQRISGAGGVQWTPGGVALCAAADDQYDPTITSDGAGGAIITWYDYRSGSGDVFARRILANGTPQWTADGVALCTAAGTQNVCVITSDMSGGGIVAWADGRAGNSDIYAQRVDQAGQLGGSPRIDVPGDGAGVVFALDPPRPNPSRGGALRFSLSLPGAESATLQLVDVRGRLVASQEVGSLGAGRHVVDLASGMKLRAGVYLVRLTQGGLARTTRAVVLD